MSSSASVLFNAVGIGLIVSIVSLVAFGISTGVLPRVR